MTEDGKGTVDGCVAMAKVVRQLTTERLTVSVPAVVDVGDDVVDVGDDALVVVEEPLWPPLQPAITSAISEL